MGEDRMRICIDAYVAAWNEMDGAKRRALIEAACSSELTMVTSGRRIAGRDELEAVIADFQRRRPGERVFLSSGVDIQGQLFRFAGRTESSMGGPPAEGLDTGECDDDGRIRLILTFIGAAPPRE